MRASSDLPSACVRSAPPHRAFDPGELVSFNGHKGKVSRYTDAGLVVVTFGHGKRRELPESDLSSFIPWWSDRD